MQGELAAKVKEIERLRGFLQEEHTRRRVLQEERDQASADLHRAGSEIEHQRLLNEEQAFALEENPKP